MAVGEVVFNTAMTGYQEILTDPSYTGQIVTLTYPHIGNVGVNQDDVESSDVHVAGLVIRSESPVVSNWRGQRSLTEYLKQNGIVALAEVDTRRLTRILRTTGAQTAALLLPPKANSLIMKSLLRLKLLQKHLEWSARNWLLKSARHIATNGAKVLGVWTMARPVPVRSSLKTIPTAWSLGTSA